MCYNYFFELGYTFTPICFLNHAVCFLDSYNRVMLIQMAFCHFEVFCRLPCWSSSFWWSSWCACLECTWQPTSLIRSSVELYQVWKLFRAKKGSSGSQKRLYNFEICRTCIFSSTLQNHNRDHGV